MKQIYLVTGRPGTGKTSLIKQAAAEMTGKAGGFYTEEIRSQGVRQGFRLVTLDGQKTILAHVDTKSPYRVGKYGVDIDALGRIGVQALRRADEEQRLVVVDEIGKMELFSASFRQTVLDIVEGGHRLLGTIMLKPNPWADAIKRRPEVELVTTTRENYQQVLSGIRQWLQEVNKD
jgi:nucleoside-triphosphatase